MTKKVNKEKLLGRQKEILQEKHELEAEARMIRKTLAEEDRKARTHRLCIRGGMLEAFLLDPETIDDDTVMNLLKNLFNLPGAKKLVESAVNQHSGVSNTADSTANQSTELVIEDFEDEEGDEADRDEEWTDMK